MLELFVALGLIVVAIGIVVGLILAFIEILRGGGRTGRVSSGVAGTLSELDRVVRPSVEHVVKARNAVKKREEGIGGE